MINLPKTILLFWKYLQTQAKHYNLSIQIQPITASLIVLRCVTQAYFGREQLRPVPQSAGRARAPLSTARYIILRCSIRWTGQDEHCFSFHSSIRILDDCKCAMIESLFAPSVVRNETPGLTRVLHMFNYS